MFDSGLMRQGAGRDSAIRFSTLSRTSSFPGLCAGVLNGFLWQLPGPFTAPAIASGKTNCSGPIYGAD